MSSVTRMINVVTGANWRAKKRAQEDQQITHDIKNMQHMAVEDMLDKDTSMTMKRLMLIDAYFKWNENRAVNEMIIGVFNIPDEFIERFLNVIFRDNKTRKNWLTLRINYRVASNIITTMSVKCTTFAIKNFIMR